MAFELAAAKVAPLRPKRRRVPHVWILAAALCASILSCQKQEPPPLALGVLAKAQAVKADQRATFPQDPKDPSSYATEFSRWKYYVHSPWQAVADSIASDPLVIGRYARTDGSSIPGDSQLQASFDPIGSRGNPPKAGDVGISVHAGQQGLGILETSAESEWSTVTLIEVISVSKSK